MRKPVSLFIVLATIQIGFSQQPFEPGHIIGGGFGYTIQYFIDHHASPMRYRDDAAVFFLQYIRMTTNGQHRVLLAYNGGTFNTTVTEAGRMFENYYRLSIQGGYSHRIQSLSGSRFRLMGGFYFDNHFTYRKHYYFIERSEIFAEYISAFHPAVEARYRFGGGAELRYRAAASVIAIVYHSPYAIRGPMRVSFQLFNSFHQIDSRVSLRYPFTNRLQGELAHTFNYYRHSLPQDFKFAGDYFQILIGYRI
jgi:hypothetical protein